MRRWKGQGHGVGIRRGRGEETIKGSAGRIRAGCAVPETRGEATRCRPAYGPENRLGQELASAAMTGMKCDECERLLRYRAEVVAVYEADGELRGRPVSARP